MFTGQMVFLLLNQQYEITGRMPSTTDTHSRDNILGAQSTDLVLREDMMPCSHRLSNATTRQNMQQNLSHLQ